MEALVQKKEAKSRFSADFWSNISKELQYMKKTVKAFEKYEIFMYRTDCTSSYPYHRRILLILWFVLGRGFENLTPVQGKVIDFCTYIYPCILVLSLSVVYIQTVLTHYTLRWKAL